MDKATDLKHSHSNDLKIKEYIESFNPLERIAYDIAKKRLKTSFDIEKSIGFKTKTSS
jgi:hypothetical protein